MYIDLPILVIIAYLLFCMSVKSLIICILFYIFFFINIYFIVLGQLFAAIISNPVYYRSNSSLEKLFATNLRPRDKLFATNLQPGIHDKRLSKG